MSKVDPIDIARMLRRMQKRRDPEGVEAGKPKGLPKSPNNSDSESDEGVYSMEKLTDPGNIGGVTGTGSGPEL